MSQSNIMRQLRLRITPELYGTMRRLWKKHVTAEDARDITTILTTLTEDCVFETVQTGNVWHGHEGATQFHQELFTAFPDLAFNLQNIVIGPQGIYQEIILSGTFQADWNAYKAHGKRVEFPILILYPWDMEQGLFAGERAFVGSDEQLLSH